MPAVSAARTKPHSSRPNVASATAGPMTFSAPDLGHVEEAEARARPTQTQVRRAELGPALAQLRQRAGARGRAAGASAPGSGRRTRPRARNVAASTAIPQPGPTAATRMPPSAAPAIIAVLMPRRLIALAAAAAPPARSAAACADGGREGERGDGAVDRGERQRRRATVAVSVSTGRRHRGLGQQRQHAGHDQHEPARQPVGEHAAEQQQAARWSTTGRRRPGRGQSPTR